MYDMIKSNSKSVSDNLSTNLGKRKTSYISDNFAAVYQGDKRQKTSNQGAFNIVSP